MACILSCSISTVFVIAMIYFYNATTNSEVVKHYKQSLSSDLQIRYEKIANERRAISYYGYCLGFILSLLIVFFNVKLKKNKFDYRATVCLVLATSFVVNYFYYVLSPKSDWMLNHLQNQEQTKTWLLMYRDMQYNYHKGLVLGIIAVGFMAFAFRC